MLFGYPHGTAIDTTDFVPVTFWILTCDGYRDIWPQLCNQRIIRPRACTQTYQAARYQYKWGWSDGRCRSWHDNGWRNSREGRRRLDHELQCRHDFNGGRQ